MSRKLLSSITILILCCISLFAGVFAASNANHTISGNLWHDVATGVSAKVTTFEFTNTATNCTYYNSSVGHNSATTADLFTLTSGVTNVTITDSNGKLTITGSGSGTSQTITYTGTSNLTGTLTCTITATGQSATITYTTKYTNYDHAWEWKDNGDDAHWEECINCEEQQNHGLHEYSSAEDNGDGTHTATCDECGLTGYGYYHVESNGEYERDDYDDSNCWNYCDLCGAITDDSTHSIEWTENTDPTYHWDCCVYCSCQINKEEHSAESVNYDNGYHWSVCSCGYEMDKEVHALGAGEIYDQDVSTLVEPTCTVDGMNLWTDYYETYCEICDYITNYTAERYEVIPATGHDWSYSYNYQDKTYCAMECYNCQELDYQSHVFDGSGVCGFCGWNKYTNPDGLSLMVLSPQSALSTPALSTYGVLNSTLSLAQSSGMLEAPDVTGKNSLLYNYKKQYSNKVKKLLSLMQKS